MKDLYYVNDKQERVGPIDLVDVSLHPITADTLVWRKGMVQWEYAGNLPEVSQYLSSSSVPPIPNRSWSTHTHEIPALYKDKPSSYLWLSILTTLFCCIPFGIVGIVYSGKVDGLWMQGRYDEAAKSSKKALTWSLIGIICSLLVWAVYIGGLIALGVEVADVFMDAYDYGGYYDYLD